jgi:hypothetical protein
MIRVEITETTWQTENGMPCTNEPVDTGADIPILKTERTLLVQEFSELNITPIVALLNGLQTEPMCSCGHPKHSGRCNVVKNEGSMGMTYSRDQCDCKDYRTPEQAKADKMGEALLQSECTLAGTETKLEVAQDEIERLTRRHDNLVRRRKKSGAKRR